MKSLLTLTVLAGLLTGCSHAMHLSHVDDVQPIIRDKDARRIKAEAEQFVVMGFVKETNYVNQAMAELERKCDGGTITGINTRYSTSHGFFSWTNKIRMSAWCIR